MSHASRRSARVTGALFLCSLALAGAQEAPKTTVVTKKGEDALAALDEIEEMILRGHVLPGHCPEKFNVATARVAAYAARHGTDSDLATALGWAVSNYRFPLQPWKGPSKVWEEAPHGFWAASSYAAYAKELAKDASPHEETSEVGTLTPGQQVKGRLGRGDQRVPASLDKDRAGFVADVYQLKLDARGELTFTISASPCAPVLLIADGSGKRVADKESPLEWKKSFGPGDYRVWVACWSVGTYTPWASVEH